MRKLMKTAVVILALVFAGTLLYAAGPAKKIRIAGMNPWVSTPYQPAFIEWSKKKAAEYGAEYVVFDGEFDPQKMYDQAETIIAQKFDGVQMECNDAASGSKLVKRFAQAGIPVVTTVSPPGHDVDGIQVSYVGVDCYQEGLQNGQIIAKLAGNKDVNVVLIEGTMSLAASVQRTQGYNDAWKGKKNIHLVGEQPADFDRAKSMAIMENFLNANPKIDFVACHDDPMAVGAIQAIKAAGRMKEMKVLGIGGSTDGVNAIKAGEMYASVNHPPEGEGADSMDVLCRYILKGEKFPPLIRVKSVPITKDNYAQFTPKW
jgi:ribose transport system substrate-binding protein